MTARSLRCIALAALIVPAAFGSVGAQAQELREIFLGKTISNLQTGAGAVGVDPRPPGPDYGGPYWFWADIVAGPDLGAITTPSFSGPLRTDLPGLQAWYNGGKLSYNERDRAWEAGTNGNDWGGPTQDALNFLFPNGTYSFNFAAQDLSLTLAGGFPGLAPLFSVSGGVWSGGRYVFDVADTLTLTTNVWPGYGHHADDAISVWIGDAFALTFASQDPGANQLTLVLPPHSLQSGRGYVAGGDFAALSDSKPIPGFPGAMAYAFYQQETYFEVVAVPEPATSVQAVAGLLLLGGLIQRRRARAHGTSDRPQLGSKAAPILT